MKIENRLPSPICFSIVFDTKEKPMYKKSIILTTGINEIADSDYNVLREQQMFKNFCLTSSIRVLSNEVDSVLNKKQDTSQVQREVVTPLEVNEDIHMKLSKSKRRTQQGGI